MSRSTTIFTWENFGLKYVQIPQTDLRPSQICLGTGPYSTPDFGRDTAYALLDAYLASGGNFLDTAHVYADWIPGTKSSGEKFLGQWLADTGVRDQVILATKGAHPLLSSMNVPRMSPAEIATDVNESLEYFCVDTIDLYWLHRDDIARPVGEIIESLNEHIRAGKLRAIGCSNWRVERIREAQAYASAHGLHGFVANQPMWSLAVPNMEDWPDKTIMAMGDDGVAFHNETNLPVIPFSSQARGFFTKLASGKPLSQGDQRMYYNETNVRRLERAQTLAQRLDVTVTAIALSYLLSQPFPTLPIVGCRTLDQLHDTLQAADLRLTNEDLAFLES